MKFGLPTRTSKVREVSAARLDTDTLSYLYILVLTVGIDVTRCVYRGVVKEMYRDARQQKK